MEIESLSDNDSAKKSPEKQILKTLSGIKEDDTETSDEEKVSVVVFHLSDEWFGIKIEEVIEIIRFCKIVTVPQMPDFILGVINLRSEIVPVFDLRRLFNIPLSPVGKDTRMLVVSSNQTNIGLLVDGISEVMEVPVSRMDPPLLTLERTGAGFIDGEVKVPGSASGTMTEGYFMAVLNLENILKEAVF